MKRKLGFRHIETVHAIVLTGSVTGAAARLHLTQPAISNILRDAEERLGFVLFERRGGRLLPTPSADQLFEEIERSFIGLDSINACCERIQRNQLRHLSVACTPAFAAAVFPTLAAAYMQRCADVFLSVHSRDAHHVAALISSRKADIGFALEVPPVPGVESAVIAELPLLCYLPPGHPLARQDEVTPEQLLGEPMISLSSIEGIEELVGAAFGDCGATPVSVAECPAAIAACGMVAGGIGFTLFDCLPAQIYDPARLSVRRFAASRRLTYRAYWPKSKTADFDPQPLVTLARDIMAEMAAKDF
ncbi:LysR substrate-binding domain-containing protein [Cupriavidus sp. L7L]|uniref:LysR substrate-binding domain-containing protein n=1 Tax=Cupriavidus sp. L7L TaxID=2546443 RepID=UPI001055D93F|nr:LysR substrate-binding domain-containing protein [Cupriavidus sp. L7L]TDF59467.1 LysR family transcriptional regulator [Cupriavidus sp. L7L]